MQSSYLQLLSFVGAALILAAYVGHQVGWMQTRTPAYNLLNAIGSGILAYVAFYPFRIGFVILEVAWVIVSIWAMIRNRTKANAAEQV